MKKYVYILILLLFILLSLTLVIFFKNKAEDNNSSLENENTNKIDEIIKPTENLNISLEEAKIIADNLYSSEGRILEVLEEDNRFVINVKDEITMNILEVFYLAKDSGLISSKPQESIMFVNP